MNKIENEAVNQAIAYICEHQNEKISIEDVADYCGYSKFHFCRLFKEEMGESLYSYIRRNRIQCSATKIKVNQTKNITDIGLECGYTPSNYATVFREVFQSSPVQFRKERMWEDGKVLHPFLDKVCGEMKSYEEYDSCITIRDLPEETVVFERYMGDYSDLRFHWERFIEKNRHLETENSVYIERSFHDPDVAMPETCICDICITVSKENRSCPTAKITGGKYAVYHFVGFREEIYTTYQGLMCVWLQKSGFDTDRRDFYDRIKSFDKETGILDMEICIPITNA